MHDIDPDELVHITQEVTKISYPFLNPRGFSYFQFKRIYRDGSFIILANRIDFFEDFLEKNFIESSPFILPHTRQSAIYFWDESLSKSRLSYLKEKKGIYHALTLISRRKFFYDCATFARAEPHPSPCAYYFHILKELQKFAELFPMKSRLLIEKARERQTNPPLSEQGIPHRKNFFLPERSARFRLGKGGKDYITTYEALCVQLLEEGKSYKEIGSILSMAPSTVETHLKRLRARTGLTLQEITLHTFHPPPNDHFSLQKDKGHQPGKPESSKKPKKPLN